MFIPMILYKSLNWVSFPRETFNLAMLSFFTKRRLAAFSTFMCILFVELKFFSRKSKVISLSEGSTQEVEISSDSFVHTNGTESAKQPTLILQHKLYEVMERYSRDTLLVERKTPFKRILFWNEYKKNKNYGIGHGHNALRKSGCPVWQCETSDNRTNVLEYDALVFHLRSWTIEDLPQQRSPHQRYVFWSMESEAWHEYDVDGMANFFNWTMTYRWDSDIIAPYGYIKPTGNVPLHPSKEKMKFYLTKLPQKNNYAEGKKKFAAWLVSNCEFVRSSRNEIIKELKKYIDIEVYGKCGNLKCPKRFKEYISSEECRDMVAKKYKFYFALENSLCHYYVTEKFFENMHRPILPIVFGLHEDHERIAPSHSFINAAKFKNMKSLASYLILLDKNDTLYNTYFWWKPHFQVKDSQKDKNKAMCRLCAALHDNSLPPKIYNNLKDWWYKPSSCIFSPRIS